MLRACALLLICFAVGLPGCGPPQKDPAVIAYEQLHSAVRRGDAEAFVELLGPASRKTLADRVGASPDDTAALAKRVGVRPDWAILDDLPRRARVEPVEGDATRRVVTGPIGGMDAAIPVVLVDGAWRVELFEARRIEPAARDG
ncbi:MAG: hypothetical protein KC620_08090 [Myxococcales bacterium]|nr:hypothetical protein [Myxococcales bacterium]